MPLHQFDSLEESKRRIELEQNPRRVAHLGDVDLRLKFDIVGTEANRQRRILYNFRAVPIDSEIARTTLEAAHWVLQQNNVEVPLGTLEYVDIGAGRIHSWKRRRATTIRRLGQNAEIIETLWSSI